MLVSPFTAVPHKLLLEMSGLVNIPQSLPLLDDTHCHSVHRSIIRVSHIMEKQQCERQGEGRWGSSAQTLGKYGSATGTRYVVISHCINKGRPTLAN